MDEDALFPSPFIYPLTEEKRETGLLVGLSSGIEAEEPLRRLPFSPFSVSSLDSPHHDDWTESSTGSLSFLLLNQAFRHRHPPLEIKLPAYRAAAPASSSWDLLFTMS